MYSSLPNNRPGQSYLFSTFVPPRMPLLGTGHLLISQKYSRQDIKIGPGHFPKKMLVGLFALLALIQFKKIQTLVFH